MRMLYMIANPNIDVLLFTNRCVSSASRCVVLSHETTGVNVR